MDHVLERMGFGDSWRLWIRCCLQTATMSILINGSPSKPFNMEKGLRQRQPVVSFPVYSSC